MPLVASLESLASFVRGARALWRQPALWGLGGGRINSAKKIGSSHADREDKTKDNSSHAEIDKSHANRETGRH